MNTIKKKQTIVNKLPAAPASLKSSALSLCYPNQTMPILALNFGHCFCLFVIGGEMNAHLPLKCISDALKNISAAAGLGAFLLYNI